MIEKRFYKLYVILNTIVCMFGMPSGDNQLLANETNQTGQHVKRALFNGKLTRYMKTNNLFFLYGLIFKLLN